MTVPSVAVPAPPPRRRFRLSFDEPATEAAFRSEQRRDMVRVGRWALLAALLLGMVFMWQDSTLSPQGYRATYIRIFLLAPLCLATWYALRRPDAPRYAEPLMAVFILLYAALVAAINLVFEPGFYGLSGSVSEGNFIMIVLAIFSLSCLRLSWATPVAVGVVAIYGLGTALFTNADLALFVNGHFSNVVMTVPLGMATGWVLETLRRRQFMARVQLNAEKERYQELLYNLVPSRIAMHIEGGAGPIADSDAEISVLFADLAGFTALMQRVAPRTLVQLLNELFFEFDLAAERHGVEKIKTIGDGYMAACGPPVADDRRTVKMAELALEMVAITRSVSERFKLPVGVRVGIHSGRLSPAENGKTGKDRYTVDLWGELVSMACRLEATGLPNRVLVSEAAYQRLQTTFKFDARGAVNVKGIGDVPVYQLEEPPAPAAEDGAPVPAPNWHKFEVPPADTPQKSMHPP